MDVLIRSNYLLNNKTFRDKLLKALQYSAKSIIELQKNVLGNVPGLFPPLKALASHISTARRLYRFGQWFKSIEGILKLLQSDLSKLTPLSFIRQLLNYFFGFWTDFFDALWYVQLVLDKPRQASDYWGGFFYVLQLAIGAIDQIELLLHCTRQILALRKRLVQPKKDDSIRPEDRQSSRGSPSADEKGPVEGSALDMRAQLSELAVQRNDIILDLFRRVFDAMPPMKNLTTFFADKNLTTSAIGAVGGIIGMYQAIWTTK